MLKRVKVVEGGRLKIVGREVQRQGVAEGGQAG